MRARSLVGGGACVGVGVKGAGTVHAGLGTLVPFAAERSILPAFGGMAWLVALKRGAAGVATLLVQHCGNRARPPLRSQIRHRIPFVNAGDVVAQHD